MNKKLLAVAIAAAVAAPFAAMADEGNVTLYGQANAAVEHTDDGTNTDTNVASNGSRLGVKGWENLSNGLKAVFLMEASVGLDNGNGGSGSLFGGGRDGYVGLAGAFGTVALGFHGQPYKTSTNGLDVFGDTIADYSSIMNGNGRFDSGIGNAGIWFLPNMSGFSGHLQYGSNESQAPFDSVDNDSVNAWGAQFNYTNGPFYVTVAHADNGSGSASEADASKIGGSYTFMGSTTVAGIWENIDIDGRGDANAWYLALSHKFGNNTAKIAYANAEEYGSNNDGADYWAVGLDHNLSKRTKVYALYTSLSNDTNGIYGLGPTGSSQSVGSGGPVTAGSDQSSIAIGMKHSF